MRKQKQYDIFISYRRRDAGDKAEHLKDLLEPHFKGRISFDRENLTGKFNIQLIERIDTVKDFLLVIDKKSLVYSDEELSQESVDFYDELTSLSREDFARRIDELGVNADIDYVRIEVGRALKRKDLHIIPIVPESSESYSFQKLNLPSDIAGIKTHEAVFYSNSPDALFKDVVPKVRTHLSSKPALAVNKNQLAALLSVLLCIIAVATYLIVGYFSEQRAERQRTLRMEQLEKEYSHYKLNFNHNDTITIGQMDAIAEIIEGMQDVRLDSLKMMMFEITQKQWNAVMKLPYEEEDSLLPKTNISFGECVDFANLLCDLTGIEFEVPTESDWIYAAKGGTAPENTQYAGSDEPRKVAWYAGNSGGKVHKCDGELEANGCNLFNMSGNVGEICFPSFDSFASGEMKEGQAIVMGGDYSSKAEDIWVTSRSYIGENDRSSKVGVRLAMRVN